VALLIGCSSENEPSRPELLVDRSAVHYRHAITVAKEDSSAELERRYRTQHSPLDGAELAELYFQRGDHALAEQRARESLALLSSPNPARLTLARLANAEHRFTEAIELAEGHRGDARAVNLIIATSKLALGELDGAKAAADTAIGVHPDADGYLTRALIEQAAGADADAAADFARSARAEKAGKPAEAARMRALWARFLIRRGAYREARVVIDEALRISPELPLVIAQRGELALRTGHARGAARDFERAHALSGATRYLIDQARAVERAGEREKARILRDRAEYLIRRDPGGHQLELVEVLVDLGGPSRIAEAVRIAEAELRVRASSDVRAQLARAYTAAVVRGMY